MKLKDGDCSDPAVPSASACPGPICTGIIATIFLTALSASTAFSRENTAARNGTLSWEFDLIPEMNERLTRLAEQARARKNTGRWPAALQEAVKDIVSKLSDGDKDKLRNTKREDLIRFHMGWGTSIRNNYGLWNGNEELLLFACGGKKCYPDTASMNIIKPDYVPSSAVEKKYCLLKPSYESGALPLHPARTSPALDPALGLLSFRTDNKMAEDSA